MDEKTDKFLIALIVVISVLRILSVFTISNNDLIFDESSYMNIARGLTEGLDYGYIPGEGYSDAYRPPVYPLTVSFFFSMFGSNEFVARTVSSVFGVLSILVIYFLGKELYGKRIGLLSSLILSSVPTYWFYSSKALVEGMFIFLVTLFLYTFYSSLGKKKYMIPSGILLGLIFLTKYTGGVLVVFFVLFILIWKRDLLKSKYLYLSLIAALLTIVPWISFNLRVYGTPFGSGMFLFGKNLGAGMFANFNLYYLLALVIETSLFLPFIAIGFYTMFKNKDKNFLPFVLLFLIFIIPLSFFEVKRSRYILGLLPVLTVTAAYSFEQLKKTRIRGMRFRRFVLPLIILLVIVNGAITVYGFENYPRSERFKVIPEAGAYLRENCMDKKIYSNVYDYVWWYTHKENHPLEEINLSEKNICVLYDFFYASDRFKEGFNKNFEIVLDMDKLKIYKN